MQGRCFIPKNIFVYFLFFLVSLGSWVGILALYCGLPRLSASVSEGALPFLDLNQAGSLGRWFLSLMWMTIAVHSLMMIIFVISRNRRESYNLLVSPGIGTANAPNSPRVAKGWFWSIVFAVSLVMSANSACQFIPCLYHCLASKYSGEETPFLSVVILIGTLLAVFFVVKGVFRYIGSVSATRWFLYPLFGVTSLVLGLAIFLGYSVPKAEIAYRPVSVTELPSNTESGQTDAGMKSEEKEAEEKLEEKPHYQNVSYEKANFTESSGEKKIAEEKNEVTWESIFGMRNTIESNLNLDKDLEEYLHLEKPSEYYLFDRLPALNVAQTRTILRYGFYGIFLIFLSMSLGLLARAEVVAFDKVLAKQLLKRFQSCQTTDIMFDPKQFKEILQVCKSFGR